jgi:hypothetical protein
MRVVYTLAAGMIVAAAAAYGELVLDIRTPRSGLTQVHALGASAQMSLVVYNKKIADMRAAYGPGVNVTLHPSTGDMVTDLDGDPIEVATLKRDFAGMYGVFVVNPTKEGASTFPFALDPGQIPAASDHEPNVGRLQDRFEGRFPDKYLSFGGDQWTRDSCTASTPPAIGFGDLAERLRLRGQTACVVRWNGAKPAAMLVVVTRADADPWMRPFARRICRIVTQAALARLAPSERGRPDYAACVLVDRPDRTGPLGTQHAFTSVVYDVRGNGLARIE